MDWFLINKHLIPSFLSFFTGLILLVVTRTKYQARTRKFIVLNPITAIKEHSKSERSMWIIGVLLLFGGFISLIIISETYGYYYFNNGVPTLLKK
jgi:hypothetical protein